MIKNTELLTVTNAAERLGFSPETVRRWIHNGVLAAEKLGSIWVVDGCDLDHLVEELAGAVDDDEGEEIEGDDDFDDDFEDDEESEDDDDAEDSEDNEDDEE